MNRSRPAAPDHSWLAHVPLPLFASVMGLSGLGLAWRAAARQFGWPAAVGEGLLLVSGIAFVATAALYLAKTVRYPAVSLADAIHPVRSSFLAAITVGMMLLATGLNPYAGRVAEILWILAAGAHLAIVVGVMALWFARNVDIHVANPAWFIPIVGNIVAPVGAVSFGYVEIGWFFFSVGLVFWLALLPVMLNRIIFHDQLPARFMPTLAILVAPPSAGCLSWLALNGGVIDGMARILFFVGLFTALLLLALVRLFARAPFALSWWAYTFPAASLALAAIRYHGALGGPQSSLLANALLFGASAIVLVVFVRTMIDLFAGRLFVPDA